MNYLLLNGTVLLALALAGLICVSQVPKGEQRQSVTKPFWVTLLGVLVLTAVFDSLIIAAGIVGYDPTRILGIYIGRAPIEDFAYAAVSVMLVVIIWEYYEHKR